MSGTHVLRTVSVYKKPISLEADQPERSPQSPHVICGCDTEFFQGSVNNTGKKWPYFVHRKSLRSLNSAHEKGSKKLK